MPRKDTIVKILSGDRFTPFGLARKLNARAVLESSSFQRGRERYSVILAQDAFRIEQRGAEMTLISDRGRERIGEGSVDVLDVLTALANEHGPLHQDFPFPAGGIGYLGYEFSRFCDSLHFRKKADSLGLPDAAFLFGHVFVVFDHYTDALYVIGINYSRHEIDLSRAVAAVEKRLADMDFNYLSPDETVYPAKIIGTDENRAAYLAGVERVKEEIVKGNLLQCVLSHRLLVRTPIPALEAYRRLRTANPSPYLFYLDFGDYQLFGSSPEMLVRVKEGRAVVRPIAGTRPRGKSREEDRALEYELTHDEKERAEHLMLVDLARNDLGRVCKPGSIKVTQSMIVERYSHVMHLVSQVEGELHAGLAGAEAVRATFPAGTVSGAPKIRAMSVIDELEPERRGFYAGLVGYVEPGGGLDTCIAIRTALKRGDLLVMQAGAGIVYDSVPDREYRETQEKLGALALAAGINLEGFDTAAEAAGGKR
ncbi:MAG TPA: anthranilate synthase component I [Spirochaetia bacterium]|nr:anthranilate synthase component I [Spirochaetia bacterium]